MKLSFHGCDCYWAGDTYRFSDKFDEWWERELRKRISDSEAFTKKHGPDRELSFAFRAPRGNRKLGIAGPDRHLNWRSWYIVLPSFVYKSPDSKAYVPLLR